MWLQRAGHDGETNIHTHVCIRMFWWQETENPTQNRFFFKFFFKFYFIFKLYKIVLVLPNIKMNPPQVKNKE